MRERARVRERGEGGKGGRGVERGGEGYRTNFTHKYQHKHTVTILLRNSRLLS